MTSGVSAGGPVGAAGITVVVCDEQPVTRDGLCALLAAAGDLTVVAATGDVRQATAAVRCRRAEVLVIEPGSDPAGAFRAIGELCRSVTGAGVLVFTAAGDDQSVFTAVQAGARGYLLKCSPYEDILRAVRGVAAGQAVFGAEVAALLCRPAGVGSMALPALTDRERDVLGLLAVGLSNRAIAHRLHLAPKTVANYVSALFGKLQVAGRAEAIVLARDAGLGRPV
jgi:DNA-binding NarL/FixJ family response regulator